MKDFAYEDELHNLKVVKRQGKWLRKIKEAREQGDLSENAEYDAAKDEQRDIEARIEELEKILKMRKWSWKTKWIWRRSTSAAALEFWTWNIMKKWNTRLSVPPEANSLKGKIPNESPVGKALIGAKWVGDIVEVETQAGTITYKVLEDSAFQLIPEEYRYDWNIRFKDTSRGENLRVSFLRWHEVFIVYQQLWKMVDATALLILLPQRAKRGVNSNSKVTGPPQ